MLISLRIENFAIVSKLELDFSNGMTVFTGETGAGKSIMIDALMLALGGRADASVIRNNAPSCDIHATFQIDLHSPPAQWLAEHDVLCDDGEVILRRIIFVEGRSKSYINGSPFPLQKLKELSEQLVDIHGQHQHQSLLKHTTHREQLDRYANNKSLRKQVETLYKDCQNIKQQLSSLQNNALNSERLSLLSYQLDELEQLNLQDGEVEQLHLEHQLLHNAKEYLQQAQAISNLLNADDSPNIRQYICEILQISSSLPNENQYIKTLNELMNNALIQCDESLDEINNFANCIVIDPEKLNLIESRMSQIHNIARKYHIDAKQIIAHQTQLQEQLNQIQKDHLVKTQLMQQYDLTLQAYNVKALELREHRKTHALTLAEEIGQTIRKLGMPQSSIDIEFSPLAEIHAHGIDKIEYKVSTNPGTVPDTLAKIASGGELSRISLGIHMITAQRGSTPTLLFDEVDVGIGGKTAALVGQLLHQLGQRLQLFCVTHQPQVAAAADHHFMVEKNMQNDQTFSSVHLLDQNARTQEIARMLGGLHITEQTLANAHELLSS